MTPIINPPTEDNVFVTNQVDAKGQDFDIIISINKEDWLRGCVAIDGWSLDQEHKPLQCLCKTVLNAMRMLNISVEDLEEEEPFTFSTKLPTEASVILDYANVKLYGDKFDAEQAEAEQAEVEQAEAEKIAPLPTLDELRAQVAEIAAKIVRKVGSGDLFVCTDVKSSNSRSYSVGVENNSRGCLRATIPGALGHPYKCILNGPNVNADVRELSIFLFDIQNGLLDKIDAEIAKVIDDNERFNGSHIRAALEKAANWG